MKDDGAELKDSLVPSENATLPSPVTVTILFATL